MRAIVLVGLMLGCQMETPVDESSQAICPAGGCCTSCPATVPHGSGYCIDGYCDVSCSGAYENCNGVVSDGCETNLATNNNNCGGCGRICGVGYACVTGECMPKACAAGYKLCGSTCIPSTNCCTNSDCAPVGTASAMCYQNQCWYHCGGTLTCN